MASDIEQLIGQLEHRKKGGLSNREMQALRRLRAKRDSDDFGIGAEMRRREQDQAAQDMRAAQMADEQRMIAMNRLQMDLMDEYKRKEALEQDKRTKQAAGVDRATYNKSGSAADAALLVGALHGDEKPPEKYIWRDLRPGETYVAGKDRFGKDIERQETGNINDANYNDGEGEAISFSFAGDGPYNPGDGPGGKTIRRRIANPAYQEWVTNRSQQMNEAQRMIGSPAQKPLSTSAMQMYTKARDAGDTATMNMIKHNYPHAFPESLPSTTGAAEVPAATGLQAPGAVEALLGEDLLRRRQEIAAQNTQQNDMVGTVPNVEFSFVD